MPAMRAQRAGRIPGTAAEYLLLLAALLASADLAYAERQFTLLGPLWSWHLLLLAVVHAAIAYAFASPLVLAASLTALAGWFGVGGTLGDALHFGHSTPELGGRALACAALIVGLALRRPPAAARTRASPTCSTISRPTSRSGAPSRGASSGRGRSLGCRCSRYSPGHRCAAASTPSREAFLVYGVVYAAIGLGAAITPRLHGLTVQLGFVLVVVCAAAATLWRLRRRLQEPAP